MALLTFTPNFVAHKKRLQYFAVAHPTDFINDYTYERRSVYEQELNIPASLKQNVWQPEHFFSFRDSHYTYKFIDENCTSMVVKKHITKTKTLP
jgi:hypothetical protein